MLSIQSLERVSAGIKERSNRRHTYRGVKRGRGFIDGLASRASAIGKVIDPEPGSLGGLEVGGKLGLSSGLGISQGSCVYLTDACPDLPSFHLGANLLEYVAVSLGFGDSTWSGTPTERMGAVAGVDRAGRLAAFTAPHDVAAGLAPNDSRKQRGVRRGPRRAHLAKCLHSLKGRQVDDRGVRLKVRVLTDMQFPEVHTIFQHGANAARGTREVAANLCQRLTRKPVSKCLDNSRGILIRNELARFGVFGVADWHLPTLPYPRSSRVGAKVRKAVAVLIEFVFGYRGQHGPLHSSGRRRCVDVLSHRDNLASRVLDSFPHLEQVARGAGSPREVRHDQTLPTSRLDALDRLREDGPVSVAARFVKFGLEDVHGVAAPLNPFSDRVCLIGGRAEGITGATPDEADPDVADPMHRGEYIAVTSTVTPNIRGVSGRTETWDNKHGGIVYFIQATIGGPVKIGYTRSRERLPERLKEIQVGNPFRLRVCHVEDNVDGDRELELHRKFQKLRMSGEWFLPDNDLAEISRCIPIDPHDLGPLPSRMIQANTAGYMEGWGVGYDTGTASALEECTCEARNAFEMTGAPPFRVLGGVV